MDAQTLVVLAVVAAAVAYVLRRVWRTLRAARVAADASCGGGGCGCEPAATPTKLGRGVAHER